MPDLVIFSAGLYRGGAQRVAIDIANAFSLKGKKIHLIVLGLEKGFEKELKKNIRIINFDCQRVLYSIPKLKSGKKALQEVVLVDLEVFYASCYSGTISRQPSFLTVLIWEELGGSARKGASF